MIFFLMQRMSISFLLGNIHADKTSVAHCCSLTTSCMLMTFNSTTGNIINSKWRVIAWNSVSIICINSEDIYQIIRQRSRQFKQTTENAFNDNRFEIRKYVKFHFIFSEVNLKSCFRKFDIFMKLHYKRLITLTL
jgi:hypothetical protein